MTASNTRDVTNHNSKRLAATLRAQYTDCSPISKSVRLLVLFLRLYLVFNIMAGKGKSYKYCIVPKCRNTTLKTPNKLFFLVPKNAILRKKWCRIMRRNDQVPLSSSTSLFCCEDHFNVSTNLLFCVMPICTLLIHKTIMNICQIIAGLQLVGAH